MAKIEKTQDKLDAVYQWLVIELQKARDVLLSELRMSSAQIGALHTELRNESAQTSSIVAQELRYTYRQNQTIYDGLATMLTQEVGQKLNLLDEKLSMLAQLQNSLNDLYELRQQYANVQALALASHSMLSNEVNPKLDENRAVMAQIAEMLEAIQVNGAKAEEVALEQNAKVLEAVSAMDNVDYDRIVDEVGDKMLDLLNQLQGAAKKQEVAIDYDRIINGVTEKVIESLPAPEKLDYERLADMVVNKLSASMEQSTEVSLDEAGICELADRVAEKLSEPIDYDRIAAIVEERVLATEEEPTYDLLIDQEGLNAIAKGVSEEICRACANCDANCELETEEAPVETVEEEPVAEVVEETVEEVVEEVALAEEVAVEEPVEEVPQAEERPSVEEELAATAALIEEVGNDLVDAETGLVIRLKRSFTAKMKQSEEKVKAYYSDLKNELVSYKKINSNVSWHGDRFNFGRDTVAKININGKTLCFYLALDPNDPEFKETVYHQKDVGAQKAYESTPFMVKIKSDAAVKKALRLVGSLAEKLGTEKEANFEAVDYVEEFAYASTKKLFDEGYIKATKEKKVDFDF